MKVLVLLVTLLWLTPVIAADTLNIRAWQKDIDVFLETLREKHINLYHYQSKNDFEESVRQLKSNAHLMSHNQIIVALMKLAHSVGDGHTSIPLWGHKLNRFPISVMQYGQKYFVINTTKELTHLIGSELTKINQFNISEVSEVIAQVLPFSENKYSSRIRMTDYLTISEILNGYGFVDDSLDATFTFTNNGEENSLHLKSKYRPKFLETVPNKLLNRLTPVKKLNSDLWFASSLDKKTTFFKFANYPSMGEMESIAKQFLSFIEQNRSEKLIIDLRDNYDGNYFVGLKLAEYLVLADSIDWESGVFVLINNVTFSAAMSNAAQFTQLLNATLVGQPTGAKPSGYQDMGQFELPNSELTVTYSKRLYHFKDNQEEALYPEVLIKHDLNDYLTGNDQQLGWVFQQAQWN